MSCPKIVRIVTPGPPGPGLTLTGPALAGRTTGTGGLVSISLGAGLSIVDGALTLTGAGSGTVTSVGLSVPTGFSVASSPVTGSGTLALSFATGYSLPTTAKQGEWDQAYADLGQARPPTSHKSSHATGGTDALSPGDIGAATAAQGAKADTAIQPGNAALADAREWSAETISQAEAEAGSATTRRAFTAQRVFQAVAAWWAGSASKTKLDGIANGATANSSDAQLRDRTTHTGTQPASTITGLSTVATSGAYSDLSGKPDLSQKADLVNGVVPSAQLPGTPSDSPEAVASKLAIGRGLIALDDFSRPDGPLNQSKTVTGQTWVVSGAGAATAAVTNNAYRNTAGSYASFDPGKSFDRVDGAFAFFPRATGANNTPFNITLMADNELIGLGTILHWTIGPTGWTITKRIAGGSFNSITGGSGSHDLIPGARYFAGMEKLSSTSIRLHLPDGSTRDLTDPDFAVMTWRYPCWQLGNDSNSVEGVWYACSVGKPTQSGVAALNRSADIAAVTHLMNGPIIRRRQLQTLEFPANPGWYRIALHGNLSTYTMFGKLYLTAQEIYQDQHAEISYSAYYNSISPTLNLIYKFNAGIFTQARLSTDSSALAVYLDFYKNIDRAATASLEFHGVITPVKSVTVGATAGATGSTTLNL